MWTGTVDINPGQAFSVSIGDETAFGPYTSAQGQRYQNGFTDVRSGACYGRTGVKSPLPGSGDGGAGGRGGVQGNRKTDSYGFVEEIYNYPGKGESGSAGQPGCAVVYWEKAEEGR